MSKTKWVLPIIVISQFCCTSLWFAGNAVMNDLVFAYNLQESALGHLTSAVQFGFIIGTFIFATLTIADRFSPSKVFFISALCGSLFNLGTFLGNHTITSLFLLRFMVGFFLSGIYPVGMKIAADYFDKGLGKSLSYLVGALVIGTALPHLAKGFSTELSWKSVLIFTSSMASFGGLLMVLLVPDGPFRKKMQKLDITAMFKVFKNMNFRSAAFGYFGHMWELYAFWTFVPIMLLNYTKLHPETQFNIPLLSFLIIGIGGFSCIVGGYISIKKGIKKTAFSALLLSGVCCMISPLIFYVNTSFLFVAYLVFWGIVVIADSPLFSTLIAQNAETKIKGTALTIVNCIGFAITIISIQLLNAIIDKLNTQYIFMILSIGPILGLIALFKNKELR